MRGQRYGWLLVALLWAVALLNYLVRQVIFSLFRLLEKEFQVSSLELGLLGTEILPGWLVSRNYAIVAFTAS